MSRVSFGRKVLSIEDVKSAIGLSQPWFDDLLIRIAGNEVGELEFDSFITFLHDGSVPTVASVAEPKKPTPRGNKLSRQPSFDDGSFRMPPLEPPKLVGFSPLQPSGLASSPVHILSENDFIYDRNHHRQSSSSSSSSSNNNISKHLDFKVEEPDDDDDDNNEYKRGSLDISAIARRSVKDSRASRNDAMYPDVRKCLGFIKPTECRDILPHNGSTLSLNRKDSHKKVGIPRPLWRKRETVIHERIVQYTTVDADGTTQELIESEKSQNEIVHLECKETGEFAHRESSKFEQLETFNNEVVAQETGNEEYLHMKSKDDEYEHLESNMPTSKMGGPGGGGPQDKAAEEAAYAQAEAEARAKAEAEGIPYDPSMLGGGPGGYGGGGGDPSRHPGYDPSMMSDSLPPGAHGMPMDPNGVPITQEQFDEDAQRWWNEQQARQAQQEGGQQEGGVQGMNPAAYTDGQAPPPQFDEDAQQWWNEQQNKQMQHQENSPTLSQIHDDDAQQWWNAQQAQQAQQQQQQYHPSSTSSQLPMKFPLNDLSPEEKQSQQPYHPFSPNQQSQQPYPHEGGHTINEMEKENEQQRWSKNINAVSNPERQFHPHEVEQPET